MHKPCGKTPTNNSFIYSPLVNGGGGFTGILEAWGKKLLEIFQMVFLDPPLLRGPAPPWEGPRGLKKQPASSFIGFNNPAIQLGLALERFHTCALRKKYCILFMLQFTGSFPGPGCTVRNATPQPPPRSAPPGGTGSGGGPTGSAGAGRRSASQLALSHGPRTTPHHRQAPQRQSGVWTWGHLWLRRG